MNTSLSLFETVATELATLGVNDRREDGEPVTEIARSYNVSHSTILRLTA